MKSAHQEQAAYKTQDLTGTKQIWMGAVSTCVSRRVWTTGPALEQPNSSVQSVHISPAWNVIIGKPEAFLFHRTQRHAGFKWNLILPLIAISHTFSIKQLMGNVAFPGSHTGFSTISSGSSWNNQPVWGEHVCFIRQTALSASLLEVAHTDVWAFKHLLMVFQRYLQLT